jgi:serine/threonine-protein kinase
MSPEQAMGKPVGPRSDLYSLGVVLYEMLTGELPYDAESPVAQAMKHVNEPPRSPREVNPDVPEALEALTVNLLAKNPEDRYTGAAGLIDDLERVRSGLTPAAPEKKTEQVTASLPLSPGGQTKRTAAQPPVTVPVEAPGRGERRRGKLFPALAALLLVLALLGGLALVATQRDSGAPQSGGSKDTSGVKQAEAPGVAVPTQSISPPGGVGGDVSGGNVSGSGASDGGAPSGVASGDGVSGGGAASPSQAVPGASAAPAQQQQQQQNKQQQTLRKGGEDKGGEEGGED